MAQHSGSLICMVVAKCGVISLNTCTAQHSTAQRVIDLHGGCKVRGHQLEHLHSAAQQAILNWYVCLMFCNEFQSLHIELT
jgi:hypothetical protein